MTLLKTFVFLSTIALLVVSGTSRPDNTISLSSIAKDLNGPVAMDVPKDGSERIFICEQKGKIKIIKNGKVNPDPFLNIEEKLDKVNALYSEKGLLGIAFHPDYKTNGRFFVYYSAPTKTKGNDHKSIISEFKVSTDPDVANLSSEKILMEIEQPESNHNGGQLAFGPDNFLYVGLGDGGGGGDKHGANGNGQDLNTLLGKILRIDVSTAGQYSVPKDNPFVKNTNAKPEIWAYGLRNPWRFSFDRKSGKLFCADVGQNKWEEIDLIEKGKNYGWKIMEGNHCYDPEKNCNEKNLVKPIAEYDHTKGISVTGGFVYNGKKIEWLKGKYVFADWKGKLFYLDEKNGKWEMKDLLVKGKNNNDSGLDINSFGEDENGEIYILTQKFTGTAMATGSVYLIGN
jgi:glucose/arabinose dehydrogenase